MCDCPHCRLHHAGHAVRLSARPVTWPKRKVGNASQARADSMSAASSPCVVTSLAETSHSDYRIFVGAFPTGDLADRIQAVRERHDAKTARTPPQAGRIGRQTRAWVRNSIVESWVAHPGSSLWNIAAAKWRFANPSRMPIGGQSVLTKHVHVNCGSTCGDA